jgi:hypothetical protein
MHLCAISNRFVRHGMKTLPKAHNANKLGVTLMKSKLILALTLSVLAANTFAADGFDHTGSATFVADGYPLTGSAVAADGYDHTGSATVTAEGFARTESANLS